MGKSLKLPAVVFVKEADKPPTIDRSVISTNRKKSGNILLVCLRILFEMEEMCGFEIISQKTGDFGPLKIVKCVLSFY